MHVATDKRGEFSSLLLAGGVAAAAIAGGLLLDDGVQLGEKVCCLHIMVPQPKMHDLQWHAQASMGTNRSCAGNQPNSLMSCSANFRAHLVIVLGSDFRFKGFGHRAGAWPGRPAGRGCAGGATGPN